MVALDEHSREVAFKVADFRLVNGGPNLGSQDWAHHMSCNTCQQAEGRATDAMGERHHVLETRRHPLNRGHPFLIEQRVRAAGAVRRCPQLSEEATGLVAVFRQLINSGPGELLRAREHLPGRGYVQRSGMFRRVDLPLPEGPSSTQEPSARSFKSTPRGACTTTSPIS